MREITFAQLQRKLQRLLLERVCNAGQAVSECNWLLD